MNTEGVAADVQRDHLDLDSHRSEVGGVESSHLARVHQTDGLGYALRLRLPGGPLRF